jgi:hypothetical protein
VREVLATVQAFAAVVVEADAIGRAGEQREQRRHAREELQVDGGVDAVAAAELDEAPDVDH